MRYALADTGVWYAMFASDDPYAGDIDEKAEALERCQVVVPWPTMYETLRTKFVKKRLALQQLRDYLKRPRVQYLDDVPYRERALELAFSSALTGHRPLSMIDCLIRLIMSDARVKIDVLATFNARDFGDVCRKQGIDLI
jgi:predicted nucleic acid-binding protein